MKNVMLFDRTLAQSKITELQANPGSCSSGSATPNNLVAFNIGFEDAAGNAGTAVNTTTDQSSVNVDTTTPTLTRVELKSNNSDNRTAKLDETLTLSFTSSESIETPSVQINGQATQLEGSGRDWTARRNVLSTESQGQVEFLISFADAAGNSDSVDNTTDNSLVKVDLEAPVILNDNITSTNQDPNWAKYGDNVTLSFSTSEPIQDPSDNITIDGLTDIVVVGSDNLTEWTATGQVASNAAGMANYSISVKDHAGNVATPVTSTTSVNLDTESPSLSDVVLSSSNTTNSSYAKAGDNLTLTFNASELIETPVVTWRETTLVSRTPTVEQEPPGRQPTRFRMEITERLPSASSIRISLEIRAHQSPQPRISLRSM